MFRFVFKVFGFLLFLFLIFIEGFFVFIKYGGKKIADFLGLTKK